MAVTFFGALGPGEVSGAGDGKTASEGTAKDSANEAPQVGWCMAQMLLCG